MDEECSAEDVDHKLDSSEDSDNDDRTGRQIEGYGGSSSSSSSSSTNGSSPKSRQQLRKDGDNQLDEEDFERILSRTTARRLFALFEAPEFVQRLRAYDEVDAGGTVTFTAQYRATPTPTVKWFKDEEEVRATERHQLDDDQSNGIIRLTICDVLEADEGAYKCKVENREGVASTTGYLSVAGKRSTRSRSSRSSGTAAASSRTLASSPGVSTPPYLGPIAEQKSMEEREELELKRQPPSPLQEFIDSIRHSAKAKHAPIYYGDTKDLLCAVPGYDAEDDPFDNDDSTPISLSPVDTETQSAADKSNYCGRRSSDMATWNADVVRPQDSFRSAAASDPADDHRASTDRRKSAFQRRRLGQLQLKHRLAIDLPEQSPTATTTSAISGSDFVDTLWTCFDDPDCQFFVVFVIALATLATALSVPPSWLVLVVSALSLLHFSIDERRRAKPR